MNVALIFAGGTGQRMNSRTKPKQFLEVHNKPIIIYTLEQFEENAGVDAIVVVCLESWIGYLKRLLERFQIKKVVDVVSGGANGQESIYCGLSAIHKRYPPETVVLIHDGVRPLVHQDTIDACIRTCAEHGNAITAVSATETVILTGAEDTVDSVLDRSCCLLARAPQCFRLEDIFEAHQRARAENRLDFVDSASMMLHYGHRLHTVKGTVENIKITTPMEFYMFRAMLDARENSQIFGL